MKRITDKSFKYTPAAQTDIRKTFARIRKEQAEREKAIAAIPVIGKRVTGGSK